MSCGLVVKRLRGIEKASRRKTARAVVVILETLQLFLAFMKHSSDDIGLIPDVDVLRHDTQRHHDNHRIFIPSSEPALGIILARMAIVNDTMTIELDYPNANHPTCRVSWGTKD